MLSIFNKLCINNTQQFHTHEKQYAGFLHEIAPHNKYSNEIKKRVVNAGNTSIWWINCHHSHSKTLDFMMEDEDCLGRCLVYPSIICPNLGRRWMWVGSEVQESLSADLAITDARLTKDPTFMQGFRDADSFLQNSQCLS